jgi:hypothetical protein
MRLELQGRVTMSTSAEATLLFRLRMRCFQHDVRLLLTRNLHLAVLLLVLVGLPLVYNPEIVGLPLLDLVRPSWSVAERLGGQWIFFGLVLAWVTLVRPAARGGELTRYLLSMPIDRLSLEWVEVAMAAVAVSLAWVPVLVAVGKVGMLQREGVSLAAACAVFGAMALVTLALSRSLLAGASVARCFMLMGVASTLALVDGRQLASFRTLSPVLVSSVLALYVLHRPSMQGRAPGAPVLLQSLMRARWLLAHSVQLKTLLVDYLSGTAGKLLLALLLAWAAAWQTVNNMQPEAGVLVCHVLLGASLFVLAGLHRSLLDSRVPHLRYLRSFPVALVTLRRSDHRVVCALSLLVVLTGLWLGGGAAGRAHPPRLLLEAGYYSGMTYLVGSQWVLEQPETTLWSVGAAAACTVCGWWLFS